MGCAFACGVGGECAFDQYFQMCDSTHAVCTAEVGKQVFACSSLEDFQAFRWPHRAPGVVIKSRQHRCGHRDLSTLLIHDDRTECAYLL